MKVQSLPDKIYRVTLSPAACAVDLGNGSERGEYVRQDYVMSVLSRPHRAINLIYCYYPLNKGWPNRVSTVFKNKGGFIWGYPYDDYFPYRGGLGGDEHAEVFDQMRDIRRHGQEVTLTLTVDCAVSDEHIRAIARDLIPYGRLRLRINHECDGSWFAFNRRYSYKEVGLFFVRFATIVKKEAPNVRVVSCWGSLSGPKARHLDHEEDLSPSLRAADAWSTDKYLSLHFGWPFKPCEPSDLGKTFSVTSNREMWRLMDTCNRRFTALTGEDKGLEICEFNADGTVGGLRHQAKRLEVFYRQVLKRKPAYLKAITYYQFRDRARLGLEVENPNDRSVGLPTPFLPIYKELIQDPYFNPRETWSRHAGVPTLEWRSSDDSDGLGWRISLRGKPIFMELLFGKKDNLTIHAGSKWFYKKPGVEWLDITSAAEEWARAEPFPLSIYAPPTDGTNPGGQSFFRAKIGRLPQMRLLYEWGNLR